MTVSDVVAARIRQVRKRREWSPADVAARCAALGAADLTENVIENIESRSARASKRPRPVTVDELLVLAKALHVYPVHLLVPPADPEAAYEVTPAIRASRFQVRRWIRGLLPLPLPKVAESRDLWSDVPDDEYEAYEAGQCPYCGGRPPQRRKEDSGGQHHEAP